jgi:cytochrome P450
VITEGLRLSPGLATRLARIAPDRELVYDDKWVTSAGTSISMTTLLMHWDESVYPDARRFEPERWIDKERMRNAEKNFAPFSRGMKSYLGMQ